MIQKLKQVMENIISSFISFEISERLDKLKTNPSKYVLKLIKELEKYDFSLYTEFLQKVKIFQCQANVCTFETLIKK
jgi:hypothetical protein